MPFYFRKECPLNSGYLSVIGDKPQNCRSQTSHAKSKTEKSPE
ncbi:hypothetical protein SS53G_2076, partial [Shigella sonnei 53G]